jgi:hypothetical protein
VSALVLLLTQLTKMGLPNTRTRMKATSVPVPVAVWRRDLVRTMPVDAQDPRFSNGLNGASTESEVYNYLSK